MTLRLERWGTGYAVFDGRERLTGAMQPKALAENTLDRIAAERRVRDNIRPCLVCRAPFPSQHSGNRMCDACRAARSRIDERMAI